ncbi:MAG TPA: redox-sensing transcriptional repressor Rex [Acidobacteriota bacterium]|nr:redox-sensing transcriptional repressor Rex [Acidobacteriota bacterium]HQG92900.1 redox-sensing transcriptional repressor Rex [Acidobacteriota bacterium]HQK87066.1 redox-sensing transcriptional repressor Rex [Acidobacteriota bacterium]
MLSEKQISRLSHYRRLLKKMEEQGLVFVFSHQLASMAHVTAAQVRRDLMDIDISGTPAKGYRIDALAECLRRVLAPEDIQRVALVGVGNLGRALLDYFPGRIPTLSIEAAFDSDPAKTNRIINGCRVYPVSELVERVRELHISIGIIAVPAEAAQEVANLLVRGGVTGILDCAPTRVRVPHGVYLENLDMTASLERTAYFAMQLKSKKEGLS